MAAKRSGMTYTEFQRRFPDEEACYPFLFALRWPNGFACPKCGETRSYFVRGRRLYQCVSCRHQASLTAGTVMHKTRTPLHVWLWAIYLMLHDKRGISAMQLHRQLGVSYYVAWTMLHRLRKAMRDGAWKRPLEEFVALDDAYLGGPRAGCVGRGTTNPKILVFVEQTLQGRPIRLRLECVDELNTLDVARTTRATVQGDAEILTDGLSAYGSLGAIGYAHTVRVVQHVGTDDMRWPHIVISNLKAWLMGTFHGAVRRKYLQRYLDEFVYRFNRRSYPRRLLDNLAAHCMHGAPMTYAELTA